MIYDIKYFLRLFALAGHVDFAIQYDLHNLRHHGELETGSFQGGTRSFNLGSVLNMLIPRIVTVPMRRTQLYWAEIPWPPGDLDRCPSSPRAGVQYPKRTR